MKAIMKTLKWMLITAFTLAFFVAVLAIIHPVWIGPAARGVANRVVPAMAGTGFSVESVGINAYGGHLEVRGVRLENPAGYDEPYAVKLDLAKIALDAQSLMTDVIHVREVVVDGLFVSSVDKDGVNNFDAIAANLDEGGESGADDSVSAEAPAEAEEGGSAKKFIIDRISVSNVKIRYGAVVIPVPMTITLTDIGKESGGATPVAALMEILDKLFNTALKAGVAAKDLLSAVVGETVSATTNTFSGAKGAAGLVQEGALKASGQTVESVKDLGRAVEALGDTLKDGVKDSFKNLKDIFK